MAIEKLGEVIRVSETRTERRRARTVPMRIWTLLAPASSRSTRSTYVSKSLCARPMRVLVGIRMTRVLRMKAGETRPLGIVRRTEDTVRMSDLAPQAWLANVVARMPDLPASRLPELSRRNRQQNRPEQKAAQPRPTPSGC